MKTYLTLNYTGYEIQALFLTHEAEGRKLGKHRSFAPEKGLRRYSIEGLSSCSTNLC